MMFHDVTYDKPHFKDDNDILNKDHKKKHEDIASKAFDMIEAERKQKASFIIRFVADGSEIKTGDITAENLISYFKQEKDRSRRFFWVFGQRNKRFNALCEALESRFPQQNGKKIKIDNNFLRNEDHMEQDEKLIRDLFPEQQQGNKANRVVINNGNDLLNTKTIQSQIVNSLNQVGCCSCG